MKPEVLVVWPNRPGPMAQLEAAYTVHHLWQADDKAALFASVKDRVRAVVTSGERGVTAEQIDAMPKLEICACFGVGIDAIDRTACARRGIPITNTPDVLTEDVADLGMALTLMVLRRMRQADIYVRSGEWATKGPMQLGSRAAGRKLGILGLGRIGKALARRAEASLMEVAYFGRRAQPDVGFAFFDDLAAMAADVDVLALCCPGGAETRHLVNEKVLRALGPSSFLVNVARGSVVDETALVRALTEGWIAGAGLDVFADEPNVPAAIVALDNVVLQPHQASATNETRDAMGQLVVDNLAAHFAGRPLLTPFPVPSA